MKAEQSIRLQVARWLVGVIALVLLYLLYLGFIKKSPTSEISLSSESPNKLFSACIVEPERPRSWFPFRIIDRNFELVLKTTGASRPDRVLFKSPDEGLPPSERLLWSKDSRHILLVGRELSVELENILPNGEGLYLLYDRESESLKCNAFQGNYTRFKLDDLKDIDWEKPLNEWLGIP